MIINDLYNNKKQGMAEGELDEAHHGSLLDHNKGQFASVIFQSQWDTDPQIDYYNNLDDAKFDTENASAHHGSVYAWNGARWVRKMSATERNGSGGGYGSWSENKQGVAEVSLGDYRKKAAVNKAVAQANRFFDRDDPAKAAAADQTIAKREKGLARADARTKPYTPPKFDAEKYQRDLTAKYPNIDELVRKAELNRDPNYEMADGQAYYAGREAEQNYQRLKQIQRVIQGLNESLQRTQP